MMRLKEWRERRGLSQRKLAELSDVHYVSIAKIETGKLDPRVSTLLKLCDVLKVTPTQLVGRQPTHKGGKHGTY
jgi:HTH-type transcriptional regulator, cell division transcriptional repressor